MAGRQREEGTTAIAESPKTSAAEKKQQRQNACSTNPCTYNSQSVPRNIVTIVSVRNARARISESGERALPPAHWRSFRKSKGCRSDCRNNCDFVVQLILRKLSRDSLKFDTLASRASSSRLQRSRSIEMLNVSAVCERMLTSSARIICASNCSLRERVRLGKFREDLYQRLNGLTLLIPPLPERVQELLALIAACLLRLGTRARGPNVESCWTCI